jgi:HPt (histidine-containing phosphotransfer) domain-containing protein
MLALVPDELDLTRLAELQGLLGIDLPEIVATLVRELETSIGELERAIGAGDLAAAALAAHAARNSALMIDAQPVLNALRDLETAARDDRPEAARAAGQALSQRWPQLRARLQRLS